MLLGEGAQRGDLLVEGVRGVVAVHRPGRGTDDRLAGVAVHLRGEHVLPGVLVTGRPDEALLVAVVDDRLAAGEEHQLVRELDPLLQLVAGEVLGEHHGRPAHVVVAREGRQLVGVGVRVGVVVVLCVEGAQVGRGAALGEVDRPALEAEVDDGLELALGGEGRQILGVAVVDLAEHEEVVVLGARGLEDARAELLPELQVDVLDRVDPEAVDPHVGPGGVDVDHPVDDLGALGEQVVQADEVPVGAGLPGEGGVTPVVVHRRVVEPVRHLDRLVRLGAEDRGVGEGNLGVQERERLADVVAVVEGVARCVAVGLGLLVDVAVLTLLVVDDVGGVVGDDVEVDLHPPRVRLVDELAHLLVRAQVRVDLGEVGDPVAVVPGARVLLAALDGAVLEAGRQPDRGRPQALDVVEPVHDPGQVSTVEEALVGGVEAVVQPVPRDPGRVVGRVAVGEPVGHHEVELLAGHRLPQAVPRQVLVRRRGRPLQLGRGHAHPVGLVVEGELQRGRPLQHQRQVGGRVGLGQPAVQGDLEGPGPLRHLEDAPVCRPAPLDGVQHGGLAGGVPVLRAAQLVLQGADEGDRARRGGGRQTRGRRHRADGARGGGRRGDAGRCAREERGHEGTGQDGTLHRGSWRGWEDGQPPRLEPPRQAHNISCKILHNPYPGEAHITVE